MVYLIHFDRPISPKHTCQHYLGYAKESPAKRLATHKAGNGARLTQIANARGIGYQIVRVWNGSRKLERQLKDRHNGRKLCPICKRKKRNEN